MEYRIKGKVWLIMPVYNEEEAIAEVIREWSDALQQSAIDYVFLILNDGSKDNTLTVLKSCQSRFPNIEIIDKQNSGHGQTCVLGYRKAVENSAEWVFQLDSDGQCDPVYFKDFVVQSKNHQAVFGYRKKREDGFSRFLISRVVSLFAFGATGAWLKDANVPYRLMHRSLLEKALPLVPDDFYLANILISVLVRKQTKIKWVDIIFRDRTGGSPSIKTFSIMKHGSKLYKQLKTAVKEIS